MKKIHRMHLNLSEESNALVANLREENDLTSNAELIRRALKAYAWMQKQKKDGNVIRVFYPNGETERVDVLF